MLISRIRQVNMKITIALCYSGESWAAWSFLHTRMNLMKDRDLKTISSISQGISLHSQPSKNQQFLQKLLIFTLDFSGQLGRLGKVTMREGDPNRWSLPPVFIHSPQFFWVLSCLLLPPIRHRNQTQTRPIVVSLPVPLLI